MAESQSKHRLVLEKSVIKSNITNERMGMVMAFILTIVMMATCVYLVGNDKNFSGFAAFFSPVIFHAGNYIYNKKQERSVQNKSTKKE